LSCSCVSGAVLSLLGLFLGAGFTDLGRAYSGEVFLFSLLGARGRFGFVRTVADLEEYRYCEGGL
jgi:hypothetical protein